MSYHLGASTTLVVGIGLRPAASFGLAAYQARTSLPVDSGGISSNTEHPTCALITCTRVTQRIWCQGSLAHSELLHCFSRFTYRVLSLRRPTGLAESVPFLEHRLPLDLDNKLPALHSGVCGTRLLPKSFLAPHRSGRFGDTYFPTPLPEVP